MGKVRERGTQRSTPGRGLGSTEPGNGVTCPEDKQVGRFPGPDGRCRGREWQFQRPEDLDFSSSPSVFLALTTEWKEEKGFKVIWAGESPNETLEERGKEAGQP